MDNDYRLIKGHVGVKTNGSLTKLLEAADSAANRTYLAKCSDLTVVPFDNQVLESRQTKSEEQMSLFELKRIVYAADENPSEKLKSFFLSISGLIGDPSVFFVLQNRRDADEYDSDGNLVKKDATYTFRFYVGVKPQGLSHSATIAENVRRMFKGTFEGVFNGSEISKPLGRTAMNDIQDFAKLSPNVVCVTVRPSVRKDANEESVDIGMEQFIDVMHNRVYTAVLLATPVQHGVAEERKRELENLHSKLSAYRKVTVAFGKNTSNQIGKNIAHSTAISNAEGTSFTETKSKSSTVTEGGGSNEGYSFDGSSSSTNSSWSRSQTFGFSTAQGVSHTVTDTQTENIGENVSKTDGSSLTHTIEIENKAIVDLMARVDDTLKAMNQADAYGLWECAAYFISPMLDDAAHAANTFKSLVIGENSASEMTHVTYWPASRNNAEKQRTLCEYILNGEHPQLRSNSDVFPNILPTSLVSGCDLPNFLRLPLKSVPGIPVQSIAAFERSVACAPDKKSIAVSIGRVCHMGKAELPIELDLDKFTGHCFITGTTGTGKSKTMELLLERCIENRVPFLVIEPAKGEYKKSFKNLPGINIYTTDPLCESLLHVNPFRFPQGVHVLQHIDKLLSIFSSCWELTAAMPALLKKGVERAYQAVGWDVANSYYIGSCDEAAYPTFSTLTGELRAVINSSGYSGEVKGNYIGSLVTRVESLTAGVLRQVFCNEYDVPAEKLFEENTIVDLSRLGSAETRSLLMGVLLMTLGEHRQVGAKRPDARIRHVTVLEEAHNLLRNTANGTTGGSDLVKKSVEMIADAIAEMRTYGEGFMIVDQSPTAVDISAIKNTNTKIVMQLPEQRDCEAMANAMCLNEAQSKEIAKLPAGVAVVMQKGWQAAVLVKITPPSEDPKRKEYYGTDEQSIPQDVRHIRALLALKVINAGCARLYAYCPSQSEDKQRIAARKLVPTVDELLQATYPTERRHYVGYVGADRAREVLGDDPGKEQTDYPESARARELREIIEHYFRTRHLDTEAPTVATKLGFGALAVALLRCGECWRMLLNKAPDERTRDEFAEIIGRYLTPNARKQATAQTFKLLVEFIAQYFAFGGIRVQGGTKDEERAFGSWFKFGSED